MKDKINRLARGLVDTEEPRLFIRPQSVEGKIPAGQTASGELYISDENGSYVKGLAYSSNMRVRVVNDAFGGTRCRISYEVDGNGLSPGDVVEGAFTLVTNGGEAKVPYSFALAQSRSGALLYSLKSAEDFARLAKKDPDSALRLMGSQDFADAPFMQDAHIRTLYEGLRLSADRRNGMEEFLVALGQKDPVELIVDTVPRKYYAPKKIEREFLELRCSTWGYLWFEVSADGDFLGLEKVSFSSEDFVDGVCQLPFHIHPARLHGGHNLGALRIHTMHDTKLIRIEVRGIQGPKPKAAFSARRGLGRYLSLRLEYEMGQREDKKLLTQMQQEVDMMYGRYGETLLITMLKAELYIQAGDKESASLLLDARRGEVAERRQEKYIEYCYYIYLQLKIRQSEGQRDMLLRLVKRYLEEEEASGPLFFLWINLEEGLMDKPAELLSAMRDYYAKGCHSPFLYSCAFTLFSAQPGLLQSVDVFELQVLMFAAKRDLLGHELALRAVTLLEARKRFSRLACRLLVKTYGSFHETPFLEAACSMLIKGDCRGPEHFRWYEEALKQKVSLTGLYEYYLHTLPWDYSHLLPREALMYFSYAKTLEEQDKLRLYANILKYMKKDAPLYGQYERDIEQFTVDQLLKSRVNRDLAVLYQHMVYKEMIDQKLAKALPSILRSYRIRVKNPNMRQLVICYEEFDEEDVYQIQNGVAYVPIFLEQSVILFQDGQGNRYFGIPYSKQPAMDKVDTAGLLKRCYEIFPAHPMLRLEECGRILARGIKDVQSLTMLRRTAESLPLRPLYRTELLEEMLRYHLSLLDGEEEEEKAEKDRADAGYLLGLDMGTLTRKERAGVCEVLIGERYYREAWEYLCRFGCEGVRLPFLRALCSHQALKQPSRGKEALLALTFWLFEKGDYDLVMLGYLCRYYNGSSASMYHILEAGIRKNIIVHDLPERLLGQMLFTGECDGIDQVFEWYALRPRENENLTRAYFTKRGADYFMNGRVVGRQMFAGLESALKGASDLGRVPTIYLLAMGLYYSRQEELDEDQKALGSRIVELLISEGKVFSWYQKLGRRLALPDSVMDKTVLEYRCAGEKKPVLRIKIQPEEDAFHPEEFYRVYHEIFAAQKVLFYGETMEYQIWEQKNGTEALAMEGSLKPNEEAVDGGESRYAALNAMCRDFVDKNEEELKKKMRQYLMDNAVVEELFPQM